MRNLFEYPLTKAEILSTLQEMEQRLIAEGMVGDMRALVLNVAAKLVAEKEFRTYGVDGKFE